MEVKANKGLTEEEKQLRLAEIDAQAPQEIVESRRESQITDILKEKTQALKEAGATLSDTVRVLYILPDAAEFEKTWPVLRQYFGEIKPAATMFSAGLADERMKIEIQVTALNK